MANSTTVSTVNDALAAADRIGYPVIMRSAFTLGGLGSGFANNSEELRDLAARGLSLSPQVLVEKSIKGWKEVEYEVVRDGADNAIICCTWRTSTRSAHILVILSSLRPRRLLRMTSTTCYALLLSRYARIL